LAFLVPSIIEEIAHGQQPPELTAQALSTRPGDLPLSWNAQRKLLGLEAPPDPVIIWRFYRSHGTEALAASRGILTAPYKGTVAAQISSVTATALFTIAGSANSCTGESICAEEDLFILR
jgi:hypothetical protein